MHRSFYTMTIFNCIFALLEKSFNIIYTRRGLPTSMQQVLITFTFNTTGTFKQVIGDLLVFLYLLHPQSI